jgi:hypothetical protein
MRLGGVHLTLLIGPTVPLPVPPVVMDALTGVEVMSRSGQRGGFRLTFTLTNRSPLHTILLLSGGSLSPLMRAVIVATIRGVPEVLMDGVITHHAIAPGSQPGQSTLTLTGEDLTAVMDLKPQDGMLYPGMPFELRVLAILAKYAMYGMLPLIIPTLLMDVPIPTDRIPTHQGTDLAYINLMARQAGYVFYVEPGPVPGTNTAYWGPEIKIGIPQPALNLDMDAHTNVEALSFNFDNTTVTQPTVYIYIKELKTSIPIPIPDINPLQPPLGLIPPLRQRETRLTNTANRSAAAAAMQGMAESARSSDAVTASGSLDVLRYGRAIRARQIIGVRGAGLAFDGLYYVKSVTSTIKRGEFKQSFELTRNGLVSITPVVPV